MGLLCLLSLPFECVICGGNWVVILMWLSKEVLVWSEASHQLCWFWDFLEGALV